MINWLRLNIVAVVVLLPLMAFAAPDTLSVGAADATRVFLPDSTSRSYRHTDAIKSIAIERDTARARRIWLDIVATDSTYAPALYNLSRIEPAERGVEYAERAYRSDSSNKWYTHNYASQLIAARRYREALPIYRRLMRIDPREIEAYHALAVLYAAGGMPYSSIAILDSAEQRIGHNSYLAAMRQRLLIETRQYDKAIERGQRITAEFPYDAEARTTLAEAYEASGQDSLARHSYREALAIDSTNLTTLTAYIDYLNRRGDTKEMLDYEERLFRDKRVGVEEKVHRMEQYTSDVQFYGENYIRIGGIMRMLQVDYPDNRKVVDMLASHLLAIGDSEGAVKHLRNHLDDASTTDKEYIALLQLENYLQYSDLAEEDLARGLERFPDSCELHAFAGFMATERGENKVALDYMRQALSRATDDKDISRMWGYIGDIYHEMKRDNAAFKAYDKALRYDADNILVLNNYAYFLSIVDKRLERALEMASRAIELEAGNATYIDTYAWVLHRLGRNDEAKSAMRQALSISRQRDPDLLLHYGDILWALGEKFMADTYWQKAVEMGYDADEMRRHIEQIKAEK